MRIRRRPPEHLSRAQAPPSPSASRPLPPSAVAAPPSCAPAPAAACSGTSGSPPGKTPAGEADLSTPDATPLSPPEPGPQGGEKEEGDESVKFEKRGKEDRRSEDEQYPVYVALSVRAAAAGAGEEEGLPEAGEEEEEKATTGFCKKGDGKGWHCKREVQRGYSLCQHHLEKLRSYAGYSQKRSKAKAAPFAKRSDATAAAAERQETSQKRTPTSKRKMEEPNVSDSFYYYSGFGPRWGKRRRSRTTQRGTAVGAPDGGAPDVQLLRGADGDAAAAAGDAEEGSIGDGKPLKSRALSSL